MPSREERLPATRDGRRVLRDKMADMPRIQQAPKLSLVSNNRCRASLFSPPFLITTTQSVAIRRILFWEPCSMDLARAEDSEAANGGIKTRQER
jgi:hypothetical protein